MLTEGALYGDGVGKEVVVRGVLAQAFPQALDDVELGVVAGLAAVSPDCEPATEGTIRQTGIGWSCAAASRARSHWGSLQTRGVTVQ